MPAVLTQNLPTSLLVLATCLIAALLLALPQLRRWDLWRAMVTPLASIIGSGFLVLGPVLAHGYGAWAPAVMAGLCLGAWAFGAAIRRNITRLGDDREAPSKLETLSALLLAIAYVISVAYYLNLFGAFAVKLTPWQGEIPARIVTTAMFLAVLAMGYGRGFTLLERAEYISVSLKLAIIAGLIAGLAWFFGGAAHGGTLFRPEASFSGWQAVAMGFGLLVTVQGFETSRYLGNSYDAKTRVGSMRLAQGLSATIYVVYVALLVYAHHVPEGALSETAVIDMMRDVSPILPGLLILAALAAQFSAAVADTGGSGGLLEELSGRRLSARQGYALLCSVGIALTWVSDVFEIISYASRAFALYYAVQAAITARHAGGARRLGWGALALFGLAIAVFGQSVEGS
ncbi:hypothetical protein KM176_12940 [Pseudooceanicola sp. CBS1P-1]|uniref:Uncharacterized protein n=1 Tax=Pseudooceanicola albus TaxID=2692189 RepID=A0A6L7G3K1_9RHOB|nr:MULTISPECIES: hypothetical protein [Pseudooceanicola]MBT9384768.1 hypothetical protein [Pseudooceanicola endophyticus]MXN18469.1 hypothetical protein [Pseudooceanicola albus]